MLASYTRLLRDGYDILRFARGPREVLQALLPARLRPLHVLNRGGDATAHTDAQPVAIQLRQLRNRLRGHVSDDGRVDYAAMKASETYAELEDVSRGLEGADVTALVSDDERTAFWLNIYNVLAIHGVLALDIRRSAMEVPAFFSSVAYSVGGHVLTLDDIENGVLRRNGRHPFTRRRPFADDDPRLALAPSTLDPRIHAALVCVAESCPAVAFYDADAIDEQLAAAATTFIDGTTTVDHERRVITLPLALSYYGDDFRGDPGAVDVALRWSSPPLTADVERARDGRYRVHYHRYDWSLNTFT